MLSAAKDESVPLLAASLLSENSRPGFGGCDSELRRVIELANVLNASGLATSLYDDRIGSRDTGKERDSESGLDYFGARYYGSALGRFTSPDDGSDQDPGSPQSWNLYAYGRNSPLTGTDPSGHDWQVCESNGSNCGTVTDDAAFDKFNKDTGNYVQGGNYYDSDGNQIGTASWSAPNTDLAGAAMIGRTSVVANDIALGFGVMSAGFGGAMAYGTFAGGSLIGSLGIAAGPAIFQAGQTIDRIVNTSQGPVRFVAEVETSGSQLILKDILVYPTETASRLQVGASQMLQAAKGLLQDARQSGFTSVRFIGDRSLAEGSANPGRALDFTRTLK
jgi:RHS repeat-associated protein